MSATRTALLVIDVQESFRGRPYFESEGLQPFLGRVQKLVDGAMQAGMPVVQILHVEGDGPFSLDSGLVRTLEPLKLDPTIVFLKSRHSAFVGTGLDVWLSEAGIDRLLVSGIRTEQCCETTARHGSDLGYEVDFVSEATLTFSMTAANGRTWPAEEIRARTELVLSGRFARIATVDEALAGEGRRIAA